VERCEYVDHVVHTSTVRLSLASWRIAYICFPFFFCLSMFVTGDIPTAQTHNCESIHCIKIRDPSVAILNNRVLFGTTLFVIYLKTHSMILAE
jgi:hypothetical protein